MVPRLVDLVTKKILAVEVVNLSIIWPIRSTGDSANTVCIPSRVRRIYGEDDDLCRHDSTPD